MSSRMVSHTLVLGGVFYVMAASAALESLPTWWETFPHPRTVFVTGNVNGFPPLFEEDRGGHWGAAAFMMESLSGLAALSVKEGRGDAMIWIDLPDNQSYAQWRDETLRLNGAVRVDEEAPLNLLRLFHDKGVVKGYILYSPDASKRHPFDAPPKDRRQYDASVNVATSLAAELGAVIIDARAEAALQALGLSCLFDARGKDERWAFETHGANCSRALVHIIDPKVPHLRGYCAATRSLCIFGADRLADEVFQWLEPNAPIIGWNGGDEQVMTSQFSRFGHFHTASNWCLNLPATSTVRAGVDIAWESLRVNARTSVDPYSLSRQDDVHYTAFITTDGDNVQWAMGDFIHNPSYWASPARGAFPVGWTFPADQLSQIAPPVLAELARTQTDNDQMVMFGGGYLYPDEYGRDLPDGDAALAAHVEQYADRMAALNVRALCTLAMDWDSEAAQRAYALYAKRIPGLVGIFALQYYPYNGGMGDVLWVENSAGAPIPVISARYSLWNNLSKVENNGPPALVADRLNRASRECFNSPAAAIDWVSAHVWSWFQEADASNNLLAEEMPQEQAGANSRARRGLEPVQWCVNRLEPYVQVVSPEEIAWRMRLEAKPRETFAFLARELVRMPGTPSSFQAEIGAFIKRMEREELSSIEQRHEAYAALQAFAKAAGVSLGARDE